MDSSLKQEEQQQQEVEQSNQQQQEQGQTSQEQPVITTSQKKREANKIFEINKKYQKFEEQLQKISEKKLNYYMLLQKSQVETQVLVEETQVQGIIIMHHGNGDENDYDALKQFLNTFGENQLAVFPAFAYCYAKFQDPSLYVKLLSSLEKQGYDQIFKYKKGVEPKQYYENESEQLFIFYNQLDFKNFRKQTHNRYCFFAPTSKDLEFFEDKSVNEMADASSEIQIPGLFMIHDFISEEQENILFEEAEKGEWNDLKNRKVQHYGYEFVYGANNVKEQKIVPFPEEIKKITYLVDQQLEKCGAKDQKPLDQLTINSYEPGQGIAPHVDSHQPFEEFFASLSIGDGCVMTFRNIKNEEKHVYFPKRALVVFSGEARYAWQHGIATRKVDKINQEMHFRKRRISYTLRTVRTGDCSCIYNYFCDSKGFDQSKMGKLKFNNLKPKGLNKKPEGNTVFARTEEEVKIMDQIQENFKKEQLQSQSNQQPLQESSETDTNQQLLPSEVEKKYVYDVYDKIAPHFSATRYKPWPKVTQFLDSIPQGSLVADVGCGNGKYLSCTQNKEGEFFMIGTDRSYNLIDICREREQTCQVFAADSLKLPWRSGVFDAVISIAVIHHFSNDSLRIQALKEIHRVMNSEARALIYVWAFEQEQRNFQEQDIFVPWHNQFKFEEQVENKEKKNNNKNKQNKKQKNQQNNDAVEDKQNVKSEEVEVAEEEKEIIPNNESEKDSNINSAKQLNSESGDNEDQERDISKPIKKKEQRKQQTEKHKSKEQDDKVSKVDEDKQSVVYKRYYHVFKEGELEDLVKKSGLFDIETSYFDHANWCVILKKK